MKFIWEASDVEPGRRARCGETRHTAGIEVMIFVDDHIGGHERYGLVRFGDGHVIQRGQSQKALADQMTGQYAPISLNSFAHQDPDPNND